MASAVRRAGERAGEAMHGLFDCATRGGCSADALDLGGLGLLLVAVAGACLVLAAATGAD